jgi:hypothetical protein
MTTRKYPVPIVFVLLSVIFLAQVESRVAQTASQAGPVKFDEYGDLPTDDAAARLDLFGDKLFNQPRLKGQIIAYSDPGIERGGYLRRIYGIGKYLTYARGIDADQLAVVDGGYREKLSIELWLIPEGANPPIPDSKLAPPSLSITAAYKFDEECLDCAPAVGLDLYGLDEGLKFYAEVLQRSPGARGVFVVRPDQDFKIRPALREALKARGLLIKRYGIKAQRVIVKSANSRNDGTAVVEMWSVPPGAQLPVTTSNKRLERTRHNGSSIRSNLGEPLKRSVRCYVLI